MTATLSEDDERAKEQVLEYVRSYNARHGMPPSLGRVCKHFHTYYKKLKKLFPGGAVDVYEQAGVPVPKQRIKKTQRAMRARMMKLARQAKAKAKKEELVPPPRLESATLLRLDSLVHSTLNAVLRALVPLHAFMGLNPLMQELASAEVDRIALTLLEEVGKADPKYVRTLLEEQIEYGYLSHLDTSILDFHNFHDEDLNEEGLKRRHAWVNLLKRYHPELLAELISPSE